MEDFPKYEDLQKIAPQMMISIMEKINQAFSDVSIPIPNRIDAINLLRSLHKYHTTYFFELFGAIKYKFLKNCLHYKENPRLQQISLYFIREIFDDDSYNVSNELVYDLYYDILQLMEANINSGLKESAKSAIRTMAEKVPNDAKIVVLIDTFKNADSNLSQFISECFNLAIERLRGYIHLNYNFNDIFDKLDIDMDNEEYLIKLRPLFHILKNSLEKDDENLIVLNLKDDNKLLYKKLTS